MTVLRIPQNSNPAEHTSKPLITSKPPPKPQKPDHSQGRLRHLHHATVNRKKPKRTGTSPTKTQSLSFEDSTPTLHSSTSSSANVSPKQKAPPPVLANAGKRPDGRHQPTRFLVLLYCTGREVALTKLRALPLLTNLYRADAEKHVEASRGAMHFSVIRMHVTSTLSAGVEHI